MTKELELLAPAKNKEIGIAAINCGADAVYIAAESFGAREAAGNSVLEIAELCDYAHKFLARIYVVVNTILYDDETDSATQLIWDVYNAGADAVIIQDLGLLKLNLPPLPLYASTQTDIRDLGKAQLLEKLGLSRLILARELSLEQINEISKGVNVDIETFVHGALCVSYSGQCYLSAKITGRSANRGACAQACRNNYNLADADGRVLVQNSHLLSLKDFNLSDRIADLVRAGVSSFKIEGRLKNESFVKTAVLLYNKKINDFIGSEQNTGCSRSSLGSTESCVNPNPEYTFNRGFTEFFIDGKRGEWRSEEGAKYLGEYIGRVVSSRINKSGVMEFVYDSYKEIVNGDGLCFTTGNGNVSGIRANSCNYASRQVITTSKERVKPGSKIFRNYNFTYEKLLERDNTQRFIPLEVRFVQDGERSHVNVECRPQGAEMPLLSFVHEIDYPFEAANNRESAERNIILQLSKKSAHFSFAFKGFGGDTEALPFFPISTLNAIRREIAATAERMIESLRRGRKELEMAEELKRRVARDRYISGLCTENECTQNYCMEDGRTADGRAVDESAVNGGTENGGTENVCTENRFSDDRGWNPYMLNASNCFSKRLYRELGISDSASSYELAPVKEAVLMRTKYCIKYQMGICPKLSGRKGVLSNVKFKEPLFLCNNDRKLRLVFDCSKCEMMVIG